MIKISVESCNALDGTVSIIVTVVIMLSLVSVSAYRYIKYLVFILKKKYPWTGSASMGATINVGSLACTASYSGEQADTCVPWRSLSIRVIFGRSKP